MKILHGFTDSVIAKRKSELLNSKPDQADNNDNEFGIKKKTAFLDLLLQSTIDSQPLSNEDIREEVDTFMFEVRYSNCYVVMKMLTLQNIFRDTIPRQGKNLS